MNDKFYPLSIIELFNIVKQGYDNGTIFGIPEIVWFEPKADDKFKMTQFGQNLDTPLGVAAGPHTQLSQNIISAWLTGARYIELKTVQTLDEIEVSKPCIDMQDLGYNCEWSQELKIEQSFHEYCNAWIILHILQYLNGSDTGFIFNMSVGYNLEGIMNHNVQWFFDKMNNAQNEIKNKIEKLKPMFPEIENIKIPNQISNNITLSTMHGCPPDEIEKIGLYLINEKRLHTYIKLNPTLLGAEKLRNILNNKLRHNVEVPDIAFEHDLKFYDAISLIKTLRNAAKTSKVDFGLKLTNTLENVNHRNVFDENQSMMYMSGRALHPISINVARMIQNEFKGELDISFCGGVDAFNFPDTVASNLSPITVSSDILKPGGYGRLLQYLNILTNKMDYISAENIDDFICKYSYQNGNKRELALKNINAYARKTLENNRYKSPLESEPNIKSDRKLESFDCIIAPCSETCPTNQDISSYISSIEDNDQDAGFDIIMQTNPFPHVTGMVCDHSCQSKCTRINYDNPIKIRELKRFIAENKRYNYEVHPLEKNDAKVAIIGAGPSGLSCAWYLALAGFGVQIFEKKSFAGGMLTDAIPAFRLDDKSIQKDIELIRSIGVKIEFNYKVDSNNFAKLQQDYDYVYIANGAQNAKNLALQNSNCEGVLNSLKFLSDIRHGNTIELGNRVCVLGGGNTAMDVARTAKRLVSKNGTVTILYRRTRNEMPAEFEEIMATRQEEIEIIELVSPKEIKIENNKIKSLVCIKNKLSTPDESGRRKPVPIPDSEFELQFDTIIPAFGQNIDIDFIDMTQINGFDTEYENIFIGGDALNGAETVIKAVADGKNIARNIILKHTGFAWNKPYYEKPITEEEHIYSRTKRLYSERLKMLPPRDRMNFEPVIEVLSKRAAQTESQRCLHCDDYCSICVSVCPNRANVTYSVNPQIYPLYTICYENDKIFTLEGTLEIEQEYQVLNIADFCNECGNCNTFCPSSSAPYLSKPKIHINYESFENSDGFYVSKNELGLTIHRKIDNEQSKLTKTNDELIFENEKIIAKFELNSLELLEYELRSESDYSKELTEIIEMNILLNIIPEIIQINENTR